GRPPRHRARRVRRPRGPGPAADPTQRLRRLSSDRVLALGRVVTADGQAAGGRGRSPATAVLEADPVERARGLCLPGGLHAPAGGDPGGISARRARPLATGPLALRASPLDAPAAPPLAPRISCTPRGSCSRLRASVNAFGTGTSTQARP